MLSLWSTPVPLLPDPDEAARRVEEERAATRQQLVHGWDLRTRQMLGEVVGRTPQVGGGGRCFAKAGEEEGGLWSD